MIKTNVAFLRAGFYSDNQSNLKSFQKALIGWKKACPPKKPLLFWSCKQANSLNSNFIGYQKCSKNIGLKVGIRPSLHENQNMNS